MISCSGLTRRFGDFTAVDNLAFEVPKGAVCAFLGPNGAGKSTTVKMLTGLLAPTSGEVRISGFDPARDPLRVRRRIGVLPETLGLFDALTVEEHLLMSGPVYGLSRHETKYRAAQLLEALALTDGRNTFAAECSHGTRKKTALAMALLHNPEVLFLDEPFEGIDPVTSKVIRELLVAIAARGVTVFFTSHILSIVSSLASELIMIRQGRIVWNSPVGELPGHLEDFYFELLEAERKLEMEWLGWPRS